jgi:hypothetical protein
MYQWNQIDVNLITSLFLYGANGQPSDLANASLIKELKGPGSKGPGSN